MNLLMVGAAEGQDVDEKMDEELPGGGAVCSSGAEALRSHIRGAISPRGNALAVPRPVSPLHLVQSVRPSSPAHRESGGRTAMVQVDYQFASEKKDVEISAERSSRLGRC